jgi:glycosyltransferase involved in cell wall biosynthesis
MFNVEALFNIADFMVLSSMREGLPFVILEAASLSKPHIATYVGGVSEFIVDGETGILIPPGDPNKLADAIKKLLEKPALVKTLGRNAREKYLQQFTYERFIDQTLEVYRPYFSDRTSVNQ